MAVFCDDGLVLAQVLKQPPISPSRDKDKSLSLDILEAGASKDAPERQGTGSPAAVLSDVFHINSFQNHWHPQQKAPWNLSVEVAAFKEICWVWGCWGHVL